MTLYGVPTRAEVARYYAGRSGFQAPRPVGGFTNEGRDYYKDLLSEEGGFAEKILTESSEHNPGFDPRVWARSNAGGALGRTPGLLRGRISAVVKSKVRDYSADSVGAAAKRVGSEAASRAGDTVGAIVDGAVAAAGGGDGGAAATGSGNPSLHRSVNFLYNPTTVAHNYSIETSVLPQGAISPDDESPRYAASGQTLSWTLYFNRTYEVASDQENPGVLADVQALEYLLGTKNGQGIMAIPVLALLGSTSDRKPFGFAGFISDLNVSYLQFSARMIPTVAMVQVGVTRRLLAESLNSSSTADPPAGSPGARFRTDDDQFATVT